MKLITADILDKLRKTPLYTHEKTPKDKIPIIVKFFAPWSGWTWYVTEGCPIKKLPDGTYEVAPASECDSWLFFGYVEGLENEMGYFTLYELESITGPFGLKIERDMYFTGKMLSCLKSHTPVE